MIDYGLLFDSNFFAFLLVAFFILIALFSYYLTSFHFALFAFFTALTMVLFRTSMPGIAWITLATAVIIVLHWLWIKAKEKTGKYRDKARDDLEKEWKKVESAKGSYPPLKTWDESLHTAGKKSAEAVFAKDP